MAVEKAAFELPFGDFGKIARAGRTAFEETLDNFENTFAAVSKDSIRRKLKKNIGKIEVSIQSFDSEKKA